MQFSGVRRTRSSFAYKLTGAVLACLGTVAVASAAHAAAVTFNYTGADVMYTIDPGTYRITVFGAQGGSTTDSPGGDGAEGGLGAEASAIYKIGETLNLRIGVGGAAPNSDLAAGGGGASFVDFVVGSPGFGILLLVGGGGGGAYSDSRDSFIANGGNGKTTPTDPGANGLARGGGGGGGYNTDGQSDLFGGQGGQQLLEGGAPGQRASPGGFGGGGGGVDSDELDQGNGGGGGGGYNGGDGGYDVYNSDQPGLSDFFASQGGTSYVNDDPLGCDPDEPSPACFVGGLVLATGAQVGGEGLGNGSVVIEPVSGLAVPEPPTWLLMIGAIPLIGLLRSRGWRQAGLSAATGPFRFVGLERANR